MRVAILSDIHGNLEALEQVLGDLGSRAVEEIVCLGDLIGYGPDPEAVIDCVIAHRMLAIIGNHETALSSPTDRRWMNFQTRENNIATEMLLSPAGLRYCAELPRTARRHGALFVHGCPPDSVLKYLSLLSDHDIRAAAACVPERICFVGHTHELSLVEVAARTVVRTRLSEGVLQLDPVTPCLVNAGSVGQPRDGDKRAKYLIWDSASGRLEVRALTYPSHLTAEKILSRGFPEAYARRIRD